MAAVPRVLIVAGSDSGGGAGIQADIKACSALGAFATTAVTALTAQDTTGVHGVHAVPADFISHQAKVVVNDIGVHVIKTGMLPNSAAITAVASLIDDLRSAPAARHGNEKDAVLGAPLLVLDPVMVSASGHSLIDVEAVSTLTGVLMPRALLVTPNLPEASALLGGRKIESVEDMRAAARDIAKQYGPRAVLMKGGHLGNEASERVTDILYDSETGVTTEWSDARIPTRNSHGTGCTLASSIAAHLARGLVASGAAQRPGAMAAAELGELLVASVVRARTYLQAVLRASVPVALGKGAHGPMNHSHAVDDYCGGGGGAAGSASGSTAPGSLTGIKRQRVDDSESSVAPGPAFDLRLYAVTDARMNGKHGRSLLQAVTAAIEGGASIVQLREKDVETGAFVEAAVAVMAHVRALREAGSPGGDVRIIINDRIDVCLAADADGVHLGQSDMPCALARRLLGPGKVIGVSADTPADGLRAQADGADYLGVGTVFPTFTKADAGDAIGIAGLSAVAAAVRIPVVAIGGINAGNAAGVLTGAAVAVQQLAKGSPGGVRGCAVVSALFDQPDVAAATAALRATVDGALAAPAPPA